MINCKKYLLAFPFIFIAGFLIFARLNSQQENSYLAIGSANPGEISVYHYLNGNLNRIKTLNTDYKFVHTVRIGDIYNNGQKYLVAGISNSFFAEPFGCRVVSYDLKDFKQQVIDEVGDLRCKDLTIGDADNDGKNEVLLGTHGQGFVRLYKWDNKWNKEDLETNFIAKIDSEKGTNHRVPNDQLTCKNCLVQSAVHIVKIGDVDNDASNEIIATISSPLELKDVEEISYIKLYKKENGQWKSQIIDNLVDREFRSITIGDYYNKNKNNLTIGIGSPRNEKGSLYTYEFSNNQWDKKVLYNDEEEKNMKGVTLGNIYNQNSLQLLLATGYPKGKIRIFNWKNNNSEMTNIGEIASHFQNEGAEFNSMASMILPDKNSAYSNFAVVGSITFPSRKIGWEGSDLGFAVLYRNIDNKWQSEILERKNILAADFN